MDNQNHCMSIKQARLIVNAHCSLLMAVMARPTGRALVAGDGGNCRLLVVGDGDDGLTNRWCTGLW